MYAKIEPIIFILLFENWIYINSMYHRKVYSQVPPNMIYVTVLGKSVV